MKKTSFSSIKLFITVLSLTSFISGYSATIKGRIKDAKNNERLIGATVYIKDSIKINDVAGLDGEYSLKNINPGTYTLVVTFLSYITQEKTVTVTNASDVVTQNFDLEPDAQSLNQVQIFGGYDKEGDNYARSLEKNNDYILNVISAKTMLLLPDITVGDVLQRVSGVVTQKSVTGGGKYAVIRGLDSRYNYTTVNGVKLPSPDYENKFVPLDLFPAGMLERLEVIKTLRPDMEADAIGGVMNLVLKNPPDRLSINAEAWSGYSQDLFNNDFNSFNSSAINSKSPYAINGANYYATPSDFPTQPFTYTPVKAAPDAAAGFTFGDRLLNDKLGVIFSAIYQNTYTQTKAFFANPDAQTQTTDGPNTPVFDDVENRVYSTQQTREAAHLKFDYEVNPKHKISFYVMYVGMNQYRSDFKSDTTLGTGTGAGSVAQNYETKVTYESIYSGVLQGFDTLAHNLLFDWSAVYAEGQSNTPDWGTLSTSASYGSDAYYYTGWTGRWWDNTDQDYTGYANLTYKATVFGQDVKFKVGAMNRDKNRVDNYEDYSLNPLSTTVYTPTNLSSVTWSIPAEDALGTPTSGNNYGVQEDITAVYGMINLNIGKRIELMGGLRGENTLLSFQTPLPDYVAADYGNIHYIDYLPSGEIKFNITDKQAIRASYFSSIARPSFEELMPYSITGDYYTEIGNPYLLHTQAQNYDLRYEFFPTPTDQLLVGVFYKNLIDPIEQSLYNHNTGAQDLEPVNDTNKCFVYGAEIVLTKYFWEYYGISANYAYTVSQTTVPGKEYYAVGTGITNKLINETRPLQGQANNVGNISAIYKNPKLGLDLNLSGVYTGKLIYATSPDYDMDLWQLPQIRLDFSFQVRLCKKWGISLFGKVNNILNTPLEIDQYPPSPYKNVGLANYLPNQASGTYLSTILVEKETYGQVYTLGLRFKL